MARPGSGGPVTAVGGQPVKSRVRADGPTLPGRHIHSRPCPNSQSGFAICGPQEDSCLYPQVVGLYRLCGSAAVKKELRDAFEQDSAAVRLSEDAYPDINVVTGQRGVSPLAAPSLQWSPPGWPGSPREPSSLLFGPIFISYTCLLLTAACQPPVTPL